ncbi:preprotein translocase subunit [Johnsonella ignava ATCC 51276]|uniref:Preprotein translocase subunit n=1 Tax=Johnsonella ignava ATCC 51276 TaxID=679200 RepID=G5GH88_9FIRM|nr:preprotein translocase subunit YajC [Johnsonella ignava]EHI55885.1 preprotein translocase subunit [Johnsonella ignava ATCC 51276]
MLLTAAANGGVNIGILIVYIVGFGALMYFMSYRPQKKEQERKKELLSSLEIGDSVCTTAGFYGIIIDITEDMIIVEFGNNKNCRIPMRKDAVVEVEKPEK